MKSQKMKQKQKQKRSNDDAKSILYSPSWTPAAVRRVASPARHERRQSCTPAMPLYTTTATTTTTSTSTSTTHVFLQPRVLRRSGSNEYTKKTLSPQTRKKTNTGPLLASPASSSHNSSSRGSSPASSPFRASLSPITNKHHHHATAAVSSSSSSTPFLTLALLSLHKLSGPFCHTMAVPNMEHAHRACTHMMEASIGSSSSSTAPQQQQQQQQQDRSSSPLVFSKNTKTRGSRQNGSSPLSRSPLLRWWTPQHHKTKMNNSPSHNSTSSMAVQAEWDDFQRPFVCWAAAEVAYADLVHWSIRMETTATAKDGSSTTKKNSSDHPARALQRLFRLLEAEFWQIRQQLCVPFLPTTNSHTTTSTADDDQDQMGATTTGNTAQHSEEAPTTTASSSSSSSPTNVYTEAAQTLSATLVGLAELCAGRALFIDAQATLVQALTNAQQPSPQQDLSNNTTTITMNDCETHVLYQEMKGMVQAQWNLRQLYQTSPAFAPLLQVWKDELEAWKHLLTAAESLEKCL